MNSMEYLWLEEGYVQLLKCPKCGQEMESGYLNVQALPGPRAISAGVSVYWIDYMKSHEKKISGKFSLLLANIDIEAYRCQNCQYIVFSYEKKEKREFQEEGKVGNYEDVEKYLR
jgi:rubredoxin